MIAAQYGFNGAMDFAMSESAAKLVRAKGGTAAIDFIPPTS